MTSPAEHLRRRLVTIAARDYEYESPDFAERIDAQVAALSIWLTDPTLHGREFLHEPLNPGTPDSIDDFVKASGLGTAGLDDVLVVYLTGHGIAGASGHHFLVLPVSQEDEPLTCYRTSNLLATVLSSEAEHVLIIVDSCHAGALHDEWATIRKDLPKHRQELETLTVIASADFDAKPRIGEFAELLRLVYERLRGPAQLTGRYLTVAELFTEIGSVRKEHPRLGKPVLVWLPDPYYPAGTPCLPNPAYTPPDDLVDLPLKQVAVTKSELEDYWTSRASGRVSDQDPGWYFSGRTELMESVVRFLKDGDGIQVITGVAGSGKSAILARTVTLSDRLFRRSNPGVLANIDTSAIPPEGCIDAAVLVRDKDTEQVCTELLELLGGNPTGRPDEVYDQLKAHLTHTARPVLIVVDGVDEATYPDRLIAEVLGPLARIHGIDGQPLVRLLLGVRSEKHSPPAHDPGPGLLELLSRTATDANVAVLRTDETPAVTTDIGAYLAALLNVSGPYAGHVSPRDPVAQLVASRVSPSFLDARLAGERLRDADVQQDLTDATWLSTLADGTLSLFRADLTDTARSIGRPVAHVLAVLRATAFAAGRGLPWADVWPAAAAAVLDKPIPEADHVIAAVLHSRLTGYLAQNVEDGRIVHRPNHERLAEELRDNADALLVEGGL